MSLWFLKMYICSFLTMLTVVLIALRNYTGLPPIKLLKFFYICRADKCSVSVIQSSSSDLMFGRVAAGSTASDSQVSTWY